ncbi:MAG: hypothetical protein ACXVFN_05195 [Solirubrobacteraceae bacterium]
MKRFITTAVLTACLIGPGTALAVPADSYNPQGAVRSSSLGAGPAAGSTSIQDLRSPDAIDAAQSARSQPVSSSSSGSDFDWGDAGIGAATMLAVALVTLGVFLASTTTRRHRSVA